MIITHMHGKVSWLGEISLPVLMPTTVCGCHDTPHVAASRQEYTLHYRGVVERGIRLVRYRVKRAFSLPLVKPSLHVRGTVLFEKTDRP